jgi:hypothetical protein
MKKHYLLGGGLAVVAVLLGGVGLWVWKERPSDPHGLTVEGAKDGQEEAASAERSEPVTQQEEQKDGEAQTSEEDGEPAARGKASEETEKTEAAPATSGPAAPPADDRPAETREEEAKKKTSSSKSDASLKIVDRLVDFGYVAPSKPRSIDTIILHSSYDAIGSDPYSIKGIIKEYEDYGVSAHYLIGRDGTVYRLVKEENVSYHAGVSSVPDGRTNVNGFSIGIELVNTLEGAYADAQYAAVKKLIADLKKRYDIKYVLGHDDIAPGRKTDPWNFDWKRL